MPYRTIPDRATAVALYALAAAGVVEARVRTWKDSSQRVYAVDGGENALPWVSELPVVRVPKGVRTASPNMADLMSSFRLQEQDWAWGDEAIVIVPDAETAIGLLRRHIDEGVVSMSIGAVDSETIALHVQTPRVALEDEYSARETYWKAYSDTSFWYVRDGYSVSSSILERLVPKNTSGHLLVGPEGTGRWIHPDWVSLEELLVLEATEETVLPSDSTWSVPVPLQLVPLRRDALPSFWVVNDANDLAAIFQIQAVENWDRFVFWSCDDRVMIARIGDEPVVEIEEALHAKSDRYQHIGNDWYIPVGFRLQPPVPIETLERVLVIGADSIPMVIDPSEIRVLEKTEEGMIAVRRLKRDAAVGVLDILQIRLAAFYAGTDPVGNTGLDTWQRDLPLDLPLVERKPRSRASAEKPAGSTHEDPSGSVGPEDAEDDPIATSDKVEDTPESSTPIVSNVLEDDHPDNSTKTTFETFADRWKKSDETTKNRITSFRTGETENSAPEMTGDDWALLAVYLYEEGELELSGVAWAHWVAGRKQDDWDRIGEHPELGTPGFRELLRNAPYEELRQRMIADGLPAEIAYVVLSSTAVRAGSPGNWKLSQELLIRDYVRGVGHGFVRFAVERKETLRVTRTGAADGVLDSLNVLSTKVDPGIGASVEAQGKLIAQKHLSDIASDEVFQDHGRSLDAVTDLSSDEVWSQFIEHIRGNGQTMQDQSIANWYNVIEAVPLREGFSGALGPIELFERRPPESLVQRLYEERIIDVLTKSGAERGEVFPNESTVIQQLMNTTLLRDIVEIVGTNEMILPLVPAVPDQGAMYEVTGREGLLKVLHLIIAFQIRFAYSALDKNFDTIDFVSNVVRVAKSQGLAASRQVLISLLEGVYVIGEPERNAALELVAVEVSRMVKDVHDGPTLIMAHQIIAMCQLGLVYRFANAEAKRSVFDARRRAFWTGLAAAGMKKELNE